VTRPPGYAAQGLMSVPAPNIASMPADLDYATAAPITELASISPAALTGLAGIATDPVGICAQVHSLVLQPGDATSLGMSADRLAEKDIRPAARLVEILMALDRAPLHLSREATGRVIGTCRHFAVLSCALLRYRGLTARARCGFATYFQPGEGLDHWITEYWHDTDRRWVRIDSEILGRPVLDHAEDLRDGEFLTGGEAWAAYRAGRIDAAQFGVYGTENFGPAEISGNAIRDLAALNKVEMLPWDDWGRMTAAYRGAAGADYDELIDTVAAVCAADDAAAIAALYASDELRVPAELIR
jgi:hypothetical protein